MGNLLINYIFDNMHFIVTIKYPNKYLFL